MNDKYAKEIANELRLIRIALQGNDQAIDEGAKKEFENIEKINDVFAGKKVTIE